MAEGQRWSWEPGEIDVSDFAAIDDKRGFADGTVTFEWQFDHPELMAWRDECEYAAAVRYWESIATP